jgi:hypothetical protein
MSGSLIRGQYFPAVYSPMAAESKVRVHSADPELNKQVSNTRHPEGNGNTNYHFGLCPAATPPRPYTTLRLLSLLPRRSWTNRPHVGFRRAARGESEFCGDTITSITGRDASCCA